MKKFVHLKVEAEAYNSGAINCDEIFLTPEIYEQIKDDLGSTMWFHGLDGKHSEQEEELEVQVLTEKDLEMFDIMEDPSGVLSDAVLDVYEGSYKDLIKIQQEAHSYIQKETMTITFHKKHKEALLEILHGMGYTL